MKNKLYSALSITTFLYVFSLPLSMAGMEVFSWLTVLLFTIYCFFDRDLCKRMDLRILISIIPFLIAMGLSAFCNTLDPATKIFIYGETRWIIPLTVFSITLFSFWNRFEKVVPYLGIVLGLVGLYSIIQVFTGVDFFRDSPYEATSLYKLRRAKGFFSNTMTYSNSYAMFFMFMVSSVLTGYGVQSKKWLRWLVLLLVAVSLVLSFTRGAWIAVVGSIFLMALIQDKKKLIPSVVGVVALAGTFALIFPEVKKRILSVLNPIDYSSLGRFKLWAANWDIFKDNIWVGVGHRQSSHFLKEHYAKLEIDAGLISHAHNNYLSLLAGTGIIGLLSYLLFSVAFVFLSFFLWKMREQLSKFDRMIVLGSIGAMFSFHISGLTESNYLDAEVFNMFLFVLAMLVVVWNNFLTTKSKGAAHV